MPSIKRVVDAEVSNDELVEVLRDIAAKTPRGVFVTSADGARTPVRVGDVMQPKPEVYANGTLAPDTPVLVVDLCEVAGLVWGGGVNSEGQPIFRFFGAGEFAGPFGGVAVSRTATRAKPGPKRKGRK